MMNAAVKDKDQYQLRIVHDDDAENPREWDNLTTMVCWHSRYNMGDKHEYDDLEDLFRSLVNETLSHEDVINFVLEGKANGVKLEFDPEENEWDLKSYSSYFKEYSIVHTVSDPIEKNDYMLGDSILQELGHNDLMALASKQHLIQPIYLYDHSTQAISTSNFVGRAQHAEWDSGQIGWVFVSHEDIAKEYGSVSAENIAKAEAVMNGEVETYNDYIQGNCYGFQLFENGNQIDSCWGFIGDFEEAKKSIREYLPEEAVSILDEMEYRDVVYKSDINSDNGNDFEDEMEA